MIQGYTARAQNLYGEHFPDMQAGMENDMIITSRVPLGIVACVQA